jgi:uncharacterized membrane protein YbhN (UPF0104 family)
MENVQRKSLFTKGRLIRWTGTLLSSLLFIWLLVRQDWAKTYASLLHTPLWLLPLVFGLYLGGMIINAFRWNALLRVQRIEVPFLEVVKMVLTGAFASNFLPSTIGGDSVRIVALTHYEASWTLSVASVVLDRLVNVVSMITALPFSFLAFESPGSLFHFLSALPGIAPGLAGVGMRGGWTQKARSTVEGWLARFWGILRLWAEHPRVFVLTFGLSWLSSIVVFFAIWALANQLGVQIAYYQVIGIMTLSYAVNLLPVSINGYGVREVTITALFMQLGATLEQASTLAVVTRFVLLLEALPGALWLTGYIAPVGKVEEIG